MPSKYRNPDDADYFYSWEAFDRIFATQPVATRPSTPSSDTSETYRRARDPHKRPMAPEPFTISGRSRASTSSGSVPVTPKDSESLDAVWSQVRQQKVMELQGKPSKVESLETWSADPPERDYLYTPDPSQNDIRREETSRRRREGDSVSQFRDSRDGLWVTATFDLGVRKEDVDVSFKGCRLLVSWHTVHETERMEGRMVFRDREEKHHSRTIPVPENTKFEEITATYRHGRLTVTYPRSRAVRARPRSSKGR